MPTTLQWHLRINFSALIMDAIAHDIPLVPGRVVARQYINVMPWTFTYSQGPAVVPIHTENLQLGFTLIVCA